MPTVSLTKFLDFTAATGTGRLTKVREVKAQDGVPYSPATDYWRPLRHGIRDEFEAGWRAAESLKRLRQSSSDPKKQERYGECIKGVGRWTRGTSFGMSKRKTGTWTSHELTVSVNPELVLEIDGVLTAVKLYFRAEKLTKPRVNTLLHLLGEGVPGRARPAILDVPRGKLITETVRVPGLAIVLAGDAAQFMTMLGAAGQPLTRRTRAY